MYEISLENTRSNYLIVLLHAALYAFLVILIAKPDMGPGIDPPVIEFPVYLSTLLLMVLFVGSGILYLKTGLPNILLTRCPGCGEERNPGALECSYCGEPTQINQRETAVQIIWFLIGYPLFLALSLTAIYLALSPEYSVPYGLALGLQVAINPFFLLPASIFGLILSLTLYLFLLSAKAIWLYPLQQYIR